ncbi:MAG: GDP-mannose 4,6-dehydratase [Planctomycetota bacterium]
MDFVKCFNNKKVVITGGLGFIGSNLAKRLTEFGADITIIDSLIPEYGGNLHNINDIKDKISVNISDVRDEFSLHYLLSDCDYLFNLAGQTSHMDSMSDPYKDLDINARAQLFILEACRKWNTDIKIVFASTRQIYGKPDYLPVDEKHPLRPVDVNGINKVSGENYHILYNNVYGIRSCALRLTNTYGPGMRVKDARQTFLGIWIKLLCEEKPFEVWGGEQLRDFNYVDDAVEAFMLAAASEKADGQIFNLGDSEIVSLKDLAEKMVTANNSGNYKVKEFPAERKKIDIGDYYSDYSLIKDTLGWEPKTNLEKGLKKSLEFYKGNLEYYL